MDRHIGIDFDNTLAGYDRVIRRIATARGWIAEDLPGGKRTVRDAIRQLPGGEKKWTALQAEIYGPRMDEAELIEGARPFLNKCLTRQIRVSVISHKTRFAAAAPEGPDLRRAALAWMQEKGFFTNLGLHPGDVHFADDRMEKCAMIGAAGCTLFIDDLREVFACPAYPSHVKSLLFEPEPGPPCPDGLTLCRSWADIDRAVFHG